jgi:hypothetical protein
MLICLNYLDKMSPCVVVRGSIFFVKVKMPRRVLIPFLNTFGLFARGSQ